MGTVVLGKVESGKLSKGDSLMLMPNKVTELTEMIMCTLFFLPLYMLHSLTD